ncbi:MAG: helix-turn-helix transcriptional regulator [Mailhella sp.]|nr:helix-turn-helix transcriptional regulator [Mailhella sp.]
MEKKFRYFMAIPLSDLESKHPGYHLQKVRKLLDVKQCKVAEKTEHCDSTISDLERRRKNPKFYTIQSYLKALGVEFYAFVPADGVSSAINQEKSEFILVQITHEELMQIRKSA